MFWAKIMLIYKFKALGHFMTSLEWKSRPKTLKFEHNTIARQHRGSAAALRGRRGIFSWPSMLEVRLLEVYTQVATAPSRPSWLEEKPEENDGIFFYGHLRVFGKIVIAAERRREIVDEVITGRVLLLVPYHDGALPASRENTSLLSASALGRLSETVFGNPSQDFTLVDNPGAPIERQAGYSYPQSVGRGVGLLVLFEGVFGGPYSDRDRRSTTLEGAEGRRYLGRRGKGGLAQGKSLSPTDRVNYAYRVGEEFVDLQGDRGSWKGVPVPLYAV
ncbi:hypothetical protein C8R47DRAFT_1081260 [Mycena vitilis]|nr:hypothetical protein C8R47DRAFT_1082000 [Mycena vitilis]KAJ6459752.1 hypothetical protein C8R47DRAFT_1081260 [Mycena vitilis]